MDDVAGVGVGDEVAALDDGVLAVVGVEIAEVVVLVSLNFGGEGRLPSAIWSAVAGPRHPGRAGAVAGFSLRGTK